MNSNHPITELETAIDSTLRGNIPPFNGYSNVKPYTGSEKDRQRLTAALTALCREYAASEANKIEQLAALCKSSVHITYNEHTANYETVEDYVRQTIERPGGDFEEKRPADLDKMIAANKVVEVQFYPHTPIGSYNLIGFDLDKLLDEAIEIAKEQR